MTTYSGTTTAGGYTCTSCGKYINTYEIHNCFAMSPTVFPSSPSPMTTTTTGLSMKQILWQEYTPARPPSITGDYLIVWIDTLGNKKVSRGTFNIDASFQQKWFDEAYMQIFQPITYYAKIELP